jgi:hypothetical protein
VINLALHNDPRYSLPDEERTVKSLGMEYVLHIPVQFGAPTEADADAFFATMEQHQGGSVPDLLLIELLLKWINCLEVHTNIVETLPCCL